MTTWEWLFESEEHVPFRADDKAPIGTYRNAVTEEQLDFGQVREKAIALSTALVRDYWLRPGQTVSVFSTNTIWYAVALWATIRVGKSTPTDRRRRRREKMKGRKEKKVERACLLS